jgi:DNA repair exonuclease SbcCD nuclease subunit
MRALVFSDVHIKPDNINHIDLLIGKLKKIIRSKNIDTVIVLGDILHSHERLHIQCMNKACDLILKLCNLIKGNVYLLVGNHDMIDSCQFLSTHHWMNSLKYWEGVEVIDTPTSIEDGIILCPYVEKGRFTEALDMIQEWKNAKIVFAHQEVRGCSYNGRVSDSSDVWLDAYPMLISGHIHMYQKHNNIYYVGSIHQVNFGDGDRSIALVVDTNDTNCTIYEEIDVILPKKISCVADASSISGISSLDIEKMKPTYNTVRLVINGTPEDVKTIKKGTKYKQLIQSGIKVVFRNSERSQQSSFQKTPDKFMTILEKLIKKESNKYLDEIFLRFSSSEQRE